MVTKIKYKLFFGLLSGCLFVLLTDCNFIGIQKIETSLFSISWKSSGVGSWKYTFKTGGKSIEIMLPVFEIDGQKTQVILTSLKKIGKPRVLRNGAKEYVCGGTFQQDTSLHLLVKFRVADDNPVVRFCYILKASKNQKLTKSLGKDALTYLAYSLKDWPDVLEIRLSVFNDMIHSCKMSQSQIQEADFTNSGSFVGPIVTGNNGQNTFLCAYEHDSMYPNNFVEYQLSPDKSVELKAVKGNYFNGQPADAYSTIWFEMAGISGNENELASQFRTFMLKYQSENQESRKPYIYYNSWGRQERIKWDGGQYLSTMNLSYTLCEIDRAHEMGIEYYVLDAGWFDRTGDWEVNLKNFPDGFKQVREKLNAYGMKLGVWMNPAKVAVNSQPFMQNKDCLKIRNGKPETPSPEWETEESTDMCLVSPYWETYANVLIHLYKNLGIHYFYWDGIGQTGCDDANHFHGNAGNTLEERQQSYGFLLPVYLGKIMEKVSTSCPEVVFDFDVTEARRIGVGLQFLANGRFFILNNGPYFRNFDLGESLLTNGNHNIFIQPGPARGWFMRSVLDYDRWIPSNLFLANYQPDDPRNSQLINLGSLVLGPNSIWGDILKTSPEGVALFHQILGKYKQVREDVSAANPVHIGNSGDTSEIFEKINPETKKGVVVIFANDKGKFTYITRHPVVGKFWNSESAEVKMGNDNHARIEASFTEASAAIVFFGVK
jgi:alpha-galactosidase